VSIPTTIEISGREFDLVIFDHDGVLVDSEILAMNVISQIVTAHGVNLDVDAAFAHFLGSPFDKVIDFLESHVTGIDRGAVDREFHERLFTMFVESLQPIPDMPRVVNSLKSRGIAMAIASSGTTERVALGITQTGMQTAFDPMSIFTRDDVVNGKPEPDLYLLAARSIGIDPGRCLAIEDSSHGVHAAKQAGMFVIGLAYRTPPENLAEADLVLGSAAEVLALIAAP